MRPQFRWQSFGFAITMGLLGVTLLWTVDWRIAVGVFLLLWGDNVARRPHG